MFPEHVEQSFLDPEYSFNEYFQYVREEKFTQLRTVLNLKQWPDQPQNSLHAHQMTLLLSPSPDAITSSMSVNMNHDACLQIFFTLTTPLIFTADLADPWL